MNIFKYILFVLIFFFIKEVSAQIIILGQVLDKHDSIPISNAYVLLKNIKNDKLITYTFTDNEGNFRLEAENTDKLLSLKVHHQSYNAWEKPIILTDSTAHKLNLKIYLPLKSDKLDEVVITAQKPMIVKKDTIIYNIKSFSNTNDKSLEDVLKKMEDIEITENGEIKVKGKQVNKVLINGQEISDAGATVITKNIDPKKIDKIEVRFDEKDQKLKESLLSSDKLVVLDIKLKKNLKQPYFGKLRATLGYLDKLAPGGYTNVFYLDKKIKLQFFAEHDNFGHKTISLKNIRNIGEEAFQKLFDRPADFNELMQKEQFQEEIYGFRNYTNSRFSVLGLTGRVDLSKKWMIFFGTFNFLNEIIQNSYIKQEYIPENYNLFFYNDKFLKQGTSKNKIEVRFDDENTKFKLNGNYVYNNNNTSNDNNIENRFIYFKNNTNQNKWYINTSFEQRFNDKIGFYLKSSGYEILNGENIDLNHDMDELALSIKDILNNNTYQYNQIGYSKYKSLVFATGFNYNTNTGNFSLSYNRLFQKFIYSQDALNLDTHTIIDDFNQNSAEYIYKKQSLNLSSSFFYKFLFLHGNAILSLFDIPFHTKKYIQQGFDIGMTLNFDEFSNLNINFTRKYSFFPMINYILAKKILDFQTIMIPNNDLGLNKEQTFESSINYELGSGIKFTTAFLSGITYNKFKMENQGFFVHKQTYPLKSKYYLLSNVIKKSYSKQKLQIILEPELVYYNNKNIFQGNIYDTESYIYLLGLKIKSNKKSHKLNYFVYSKFTFFDFDKDKDQRMFSNKISLTYELVHKEIFFKSTYRNVMFDGLSQGNFNNLSTQIDFFYKKMNFFVEFSNIFNQRDFFTQFQSPLYLSSNTEKVFGRYIKLGAEIRF